MANFFSSETRTTPTDNRVTLTDSARYNTGASLEGGFGPRKVVLNVTEGSGLLTVAVVGVSALLGFGVLAAAWRWWKNRKA